MLGVEMREVQKHVRAAGPPDLHHDGARHHVAWGQLGQRMVPLHEALTGRVPQVSAFAAQRLRQQEPRRARHEQRGRMKLDKLDVGNLRPGPPCRGHAVAGGDLGIGGFAIHLPQPAGGQQNGARANGHAIAQPGVADHRSAHAAVIGQQQIRHCGEAAELDIGQRRGLVIQGADNLRAGGVAVRVQNAAAAVRAFPRERELRSFAVELRAPFDKLLNGRRRLFHQYAHGRRIAQPVASHHGVLLVQQHFVVVAQRRGDAALGVLGGRLLQAVLGNDEHGTGFRQFDGGAQPGNAGSDDQELRIHPRGGHASAHERGASHHMVQQRFDPRRSNRPANL